MFCQEWLLGRYARYLERKYYGPDFPHWVGYFTRAEPLPSVQQQEFQLHALRRVLDAAFTGVPWFRAQGTAQGFRADEIT